MYIYIYIYECFFILRINNTHVVYIYIIEYFHVRLDCPFHSINILRKHPPPKNEKTALFGRTKGSFEYLKIQRNIFAHKKTSAKMSSFEYV